MLLLLCQFTKLTAKAVKERHFDEDSLIQNECEDIKLEFYYRTPQSMQRTQRVPETRLCMLASVCPCDCLS